MKSRSTHWIHAGLTFLLTVLAAGALLPLVRVQPQSVHEYLRGLSDWIRISVAFSLCVAFMGLTLKLFSPRIEQLVHWMASPPTWLAALLAWLVVAVIDVSVGFDTNGYRASVGEWLGYGGGSLLIVGWYSGLLSDTFRWIWTPKEPQAEIFETVTLQDIKNAPWEEIEAWLQSDAPARYDFIGNQSVAHRVSFRISEGTRSIGIVGRYGAGKTSIVSWVADRLNKHQVGSRTYFVCHHSCWGFETSATAIRDMLGSAISKLRAVVDTSQVNSLPESYRQTFSAGGDWVEAVSKLVFPSPDPMEQFSRLSDLLDDIEGRLVFIVEDLDRNETRNFEIQEVLAFLERLKEYPNLSFILTGGLSFSQRIDYAKLCDHIEYLKTIQPHHSSALIERLSQRCLDQALFPHVRLGDPNRNYEWNPLSGVLMTDYYELSLSQSVALLLNTPRSLRHALGRTISAWRTLHGEIDFNHLLAINILRFGAPECFQFLMRRWDRLRSPSSRQPSFGQDRIEAIRQTILDDWNRTIQNVEWSPAAALHVMEFILPAIEYWLVDGSQQGISRNTPQGVHDERYWLRAVNEAIESEDVRDQEILRDIRAWLNAPGTDTALVTKLTSLPRYSDIWEDLASSPFANRPDKILLLCEQVIHRILSEHRSSACHDSQGFVHTWRFASRRVSHRPENLKWLQDRISEAAPISIEMVNGLWHYYGNPGQNSILRFQDGEPVRQHLLNAIRENVTDGQTLVTKLSPNTWATLYQLVFDPGNDGRRTLADVQSWSWLGVPILDALRDRNVLAAVNCAVLLGTRVSGRERMAVDTEVLNYFFDDDASEVVDILESMIDRLSENDQPLIRNVVGATRQHLAGRPMPDDSNENYSAE